MDPLAVALASCGLGLLVGYLTERGISRRRLHYPAFHDLAPPGALRGREEPEDELLREFVALERAVAAREAAALRAANDAQWRERQAIVEREAEAMLEEQRAQCVHQFTTPIYELGDPKPIAIFCDRCGTEAPEPSLYPVYDYFNDRIEYVQHTVLPERRGAPRWDPRGDV